MLAAERKYPASTRIPSYTSQLTCSFPLRYYVAEIPMIYLASQMLNTTGWNMAGKCGYVWGSTALVCWVAAYFGLPEFKHRSYRELDILFNRKVPARQFKKTVIDVRDNE